MPENQWKVKFKDGTIYGPVDTDTVKAWIREKRVAHDDPVTSTHIEHWRAACKIRDFSELFKERELDGSLSVSGHGWRVKFKIKDTEGNVYGPYDIQALRGYIIDGRINDRTLVWDTTKKAWVPLKNIPFLEGFRGGKYPGKEQREETGKKDDLTLLVEKATRRIKVLGTPVVLGLVIAAAGLGFYKANYLHRGTASTAGTHQWTYEMRVVSGGERVRVPAGDFSGCYRIDYTIEHYEQEKSSRTNGTQWYKAGVGYVQEKRICSQSVRASDSGGTGSTEHDISPSRITTSTVKLVSFNGQKAGKTPFPFIPGAKLEYDITAVTKAGKSFSERQEYRTTVTCIRPKILEDGKRYLEMVDSSEGLFPPTKTFYRIEGNSIISYGTRSMRNLSSPSPIGETEPQIGSTFSGTFTYDGSFSSLRKSKAEIMLPAFITARAGMMSAGSALIFLLLFVGFLKRNLKTLEDHVANIIVALRYQSKVSVGEIIGMTLAGSICFLFLIAFLVSAVATYLFLS